MQRALTAWLAAAAAGADRVDAARAAAESVADDPWAVVTQAGALARAGMGPAPADLGLTARLQHRPVDAPRGVIVRVPAGAPVPMLDRGGRRRRGAYDTPAALVRRVIAHTLAAAGGATSGLDPACGPGAFLVGLAEAGVTDIRGSDLDPAAAAVARVAVPRAQVAVVDGLAPGDPADVVVGNPPFVSPERQDGEARRALVRRFPWLRGRFDLAVPFAAACVERAIRAVGLVLPSGVLVQPYGAPLRERWLAAHRVHALAGPHAFPGVAVEVVEVVLALGEGPAPLPSGVPAGEVRRLPRTPLHPGLRPGDVALVEQVRERSTRLGEHALVDTGVVAHGPRGGKARLLADEPGPGRVPFADAREFFAGTHRWLDWRPDEMHRPKRPSMFERPKIVVQRIRGRRPVRAAVCRDGIYVGHTCTVVQPHAPDAPLEALAALVRDPLVDGVLRIERGQRLDLYPHDVAAVPVPRSFWADPSLSLATAWALDPVQVRRLRAVVES